MKKSGSKKNCLLVVVDSLRADKCLDNGSRLVTISRLRESGITFGETIASTTTTSPSVASVLTGFYPPQHGIRSLSGFKLKSHTPTLQEVLHRNGYRTYAEVTGPLLPELGLDIGFDEYNYRHEDQGVDTDWFSDLVERCAGGGIGDPWFILLHLFDIHVTTREDTSENARIGIRDPYLRALSHMDYRLGELVNNLDLDNTLIVLVSDHGERLWEGSVGRFALKTKLFYRMLKQRMKSNTKGATPLMGHGFHLYDYLAKVPLIFSNPELLPQGRTRPFQVRHIDIFPTIVELLEVECSTRTHGISLVPCALGRDQPENPAYMEACGEVLGDEENWLEGIRASGFKFIHSPRNPNGVKELYNLKEDPSERRNLAKKHPELCKEMIREMGRIRAEGERIRISNRIQSLKGMANGAL